MKSIYSILITSIIILLFSNCEDEEISPGNPTNPPGLANYFIPDCDTMSVDITFTGTNFFNSDDGQYFNINGTQGWNNMCSQYIDVPLMIANGLTYVDLWTSTVIPTEYGSNAELEYLSTNLANPTLEIHLTNNDLEMGGIIDDAFHLDLEIEEINLVPLNQYITFPSSSSSWDNSYNYMVYGAFFNAEWRVKFTNIDMTNKVFEGDLEIDFSPHLDFYNLPDYDAYDDGTSTSFSATVSHFKFTAE